MLPLSRRDLLLALTAGPALAADSRYKVGITTNTRGGWEDDVWLSFREAREVGYHRVETFIHYFVKDYFPDRPKELPDRWAAMQVAREGGIVGTGAQ